MSYEIDFLPVGRGEKSGDAIALRFGNLLNPHEQRVVVIDGGTKESGAALVRHIESFYKTGTVDAVICTHSDADHACGLTEVIENLSVSNLIMHQPWNHVADVDNLLRNAEMSGDSLRRHFKKSLDNAHELESLAKARGIPIFEPFAGVSAFDDSLLVLGPSVEFYEDLLGSFRCAEELIERSSVLGKVLARAAEAVRWIAETWSSETLVEPDGSACSAENNSSAIVLLNYGDEKFLFTSDAGVAALASAADYYAAQGLDLASVNRMQVPHHGSKHNVGPSILDRIIGPRKREETYSKTAVVSASIGAEPKHPSRRVINALHRRGAKVYPTQGRTIRIASKDAPPRDGWGPVDPLPFYNQVEE
jgi:beta-lactamase superfamily II metal-dependent hydrolase